MKFSKFLQISIFTAALFSSTGAAASTIGVDATVTADNHYALFYGVGTDLNFVGRNELGAAGDPGTFNWSLPEQYSFNVSSGDYLYVVAWSDDEVAQGLLGQFVLSNGNTLLTNTTDWQVSLGDTNLGDGDQVPAFSTLDNLNYQTINYSIPHGSGPWGFIPGISADASWIWGEPLAPGSGAGEFMVFRTQLTDVPEPASLMLLGSGALLAFRRRKNTSV